MSLVNVAYAAALTWANPTLTRLEEQALVPMYGEHPVELGLDRSDDRGSTRCRARPPSTSGCSPRPSPTRRRRSRATTS